MKNYLKTVSIKGLITPTEWDNHGNITGISISAFDEEEYPLYPDDKGRDLMSMVRQTVEIQGEILEDEGKRRLKVINYTPLKVQP
ncbi:MAG: hypothetical protein JRJ03_07990 [Deltaproteobacteria bacterium]|nr:hypothetical protein [Deltaproteobacteria bacterium]